MRIVRELLGLQEEFSYWWEERLREAIGTSTQTAWLEIGARCEIAAGRTVDVPALSADDGRGAQLILNTGLSPEAGTPLEAQLIRAVLDGQCSETTSVHSAPAQIAVALSPAEFYAFGSDTPAYRPLASSPDRRSQAIQQLRKAGSPYAEIAGLRRFRTGEKGSTFPWANAATALLQCAGRCWLATEIAVIGAASPMGNGYTRAPGTEALGSASHPATLIEQTRANRASANWWRERLSACEDELARAEWALALWAVAEGHVIDELFNELVQAIEQTSAPIQRVLQIAARRLSESGLLDSRSVTANRTNGVLAEMLDIRNADPATPRQAASESSHIGEATPPLAAVARRVKWLKVDQVATYR